MREMLLALYEAGVEGLNPSECVEIARQGILSSICEEIEKTPNPDRQTKYPNAYYQTGFEDCRERIILALLKETSRSSQKEGQ